MSMVVTGVGHGGILELEDEFAGLTDSEGVVAVVVS